MLAEHGIEQYLERYAEPEAQLCGFLGREYRAVLVVPAVGEPPSLLDGYRHAARHAGGPVLVVLVVNATPATSAEMRAQNAALLRELSRGSEPLQSVAGGDFDLLLVDRSSPGRELPPKQGVGLARKIGMDVALALIAQHRVATPWIFGTDADATLPPDYFSRVPALPTADTPSALLFPFIHEPGASEAESAATELYESVIRYHVLGLASANSPYAYDSLGSTIAVSAAAYAAVRGVPKREAAEDFYLLDKLAKLGPLARLRGEPVRLFSRASERVPFGTGRGVRALLGGGAARVQHPRVYALLGLVLEAMDRFATSRDAAVLDPARYCPEGLEQRALGMALSELGFERGCLAAAAAVGTGSLRRRLHTWFDGLRTLRLLHALRDAGFPDVPLTVGVAEAGFVGGEAPLGRALLEQLRRLAAELPASIGPTVLR